jgi:hypothetical protein
MKKNLLYTLVTLLICSCGTDTGTKPPYQKPVSGPVAKIKGLAEERTFVNGNVFTYIEEIDNAIIPDPKTTPLISTKITPTQHNIHVATSMKGKTSRAVIPFTAVADHSYQVQHELSHNLFKGMYAADYWIIDLESKNIVSPKVSGEVGAAKKHYYFNGILLNPSFE